MSGNDPARADHALDRTKDRFTVLAAGCVQRRMHVLARVDQRRSARLLEQPVCLLVAEFERLLHGRHFLLLGSSNAIQSSASSASPSSAARKSSSRPESPSSKTKTVSISPCSGPRCVSLSSPPVTAALESRQPQAAAAAEPATHATFTDPNASTLRVRNESTSRKVPHPEGPTRAKPRRWSSTRNGFRRLVVNPHGDEPEVSLTNRRS